jgi:histidinol-phosphate aminotransferase
MAKPKSPKLDWIRPLVRELHPYTPGEQPKVKGLVKLNTNENPYPPSPKVLKSVRDAVDGRFRLYPNPTAQLLRDKLADLHGVERDRVIVGNGSDELLALATRAFVEPATRRRDASGRSVIQYWVPSYSLYPVLSDIHGAIRNEVPLQSDFGMPSVATLKKEGKWHFQAALTYVTTPNAPTGRGYSNQELRALCRAQDGIVILDEAYVDFAEENAMALTEECPNVLVSRTFSKSYSLCFQRVGYFVGHPHLIRALDSIRDSYNVNGIGQLAALETLRHLSYYRANFKKIIRIRKQVGMELESLGFDVLPSQTNFLFVKPPGADASEWYEGLRKRKILVRWFGNSAFRDRLRITIGSKEEMEQCMHVIRMLAAKGAGA